jgi:Tfp pilus assembly protein PilX
MKTLNLNVHKQKGAATLVISIILLVILSMVVLFSTRVAFFEARTTKNENRAKIVEQAAEYSLNLAGEFLKAKRGVIISNTPGDAVSGGWLSGNTSVGRKWALCSTATNLSTNPTHPCNAEVNTALHSELYFYTEDGTNASALPYRSLTPNVNGPELELNGVGGVGYSVTTNVRALLCRIDSSLSVPACKATPVSGNRIAVTLVADVQITGESASSVIKETWATFSPATPSSSAAISSAGAFSANGNVTIVAAPNGGGYGLPVSIWSGADVDIENSLGGGVASVSSCYIGEFMQGSTGSGDILDAKQNCPNASGSNPPCNCPSSKDQPNAWLSGHPTGGDKREGIDILDRDSVACAAGDVCAPNIEFFPGLSQVPGGTSWVPFDKSSVENDDSLFEWIFGVDYVVADRSTDGATLMNCGTAPGIGTGNCAAYALINELGATPISDCSSLNATSSGLFYVTGNCTINGQVGSATNPVIIVTFGDASLASTSVLYGMLFVHSDNILADNQSSSPKFRTQGGMVFGSLVIEGDISMAGGPKIVYDDISVSSDTNTLPANARFSRVPGSWLDYTTGF